MEEVRRKEKTQSSTPPPLPGSFGKPLTPVEDGERNLTMDVLRGLALLGILIANMVFFSQPLDDSGLRNGLWHSPIDIIADWFSLLLVDGKFYPLFSFLFGLGFSIQMDRAASRGKDISGAFKRRLGILMVFGILHAIFLWNGDVLFLYGLCGLALLLFRSRQQKTVAIWAGVLIALPGVLVVLLGFLVMLLLAIPESARELRESMVTDSETLGALTKAFVSGGYWDAVGYRLRNWIETTFYVFLFSPSFFGMFLVGLLAGKKGIFRDPESNLKLLTKVLVLGGVTGMVINFLGASTTIYGMSSGNLGFWLLGAGFITLGGPFLSCAYIAGAVMLIQKNPRIPVYQAVASAGRMPLTNYLMQSFVATTIFYGYGLGLGHSMGRLETIGLAIFIFIAQVGFSYFWMKHFRFGPMEWVWRSATYGKLQPMRLTRDAAD